LEHNVYPPDQMCVHQKLIYLQRWITFCPIYWRILILWNIICLLNYILHHSYKFVIAHRFICSVISIHWYLMLTK
jgi:hypothetical protein